jgi:hypothetical protein
MYACARTAKEPFLAKQTSQENSQHCRRISALTNIFNNSNMAYAYYCHDSSGYS